MADWVTFAAFVGATTGALLILSRLTERALTPVDAASAPDAPPGDEPLEPAEDAVGGSVAASAGDFDDHLERAEPERPTGPGPGAEGGPTAGDPLPGVPAKPGEENRADRESRPAGSVDRDDGRGTRTATRPRDERVAAYVGRNPVTTGELLANVAVTQGLFTVLLVGAILYTSVPADALGIAFSRSYAVAGVAVGAVAGLALYAANELGAGLAKRYGIDHDERLRELLAPETARGWAALVVVVLPLIAVFEELLFRAALIGALAAGFGVSPWLLAIGSSILFAIGHGVQGTAGVVVTGLLGLALAALFVVTGSLLVVIVAHYVINVCEFIVHEGLRVDWADFLEN